MKNDKCGGAIGGLILVFILLSVFGSILLSPIVVAKETGNAAYYFLFIISAPAAFCFAIFFVREIENTNK